MKKIRLAALPLAGTAAMLAGCSGDQPRRPNVIIIYADDIGYGDLSCNGTAAVSTPNVDSLAENGIRFTNSHTTSSVSTPSRYGLLTGQYPWRKEGTGIATGDAGMIIRPEQYTIADMFRETICHDCMADEISFSELRGYRKEWDINGEKVELSVEKLA